MTGGHTMSPALDTHVIGPGHLMAEVDDKAGPAGYGLRIGIATHQSATGAGALRPSTQALSAVRNADRDLRPSNSQRISLPMPRCRG
jgi:hypothetical protein